MWSGPSPASVVAAKKRAEQPAHEIKSSREWRLSVGPCAQQPGSVEAGVRNLTPVSWQRVSRREVGC